MNNPFFSIIIPVYNVEQYLSECIFSILRQDFENYEVILINDGSTDKSGKICDDFAMLDNRIKVIHKKNGGLSEARNYGLDCAIGDYVWFLDSDDFYIDKNAFSIVKEVFMKKKGDVVFFSYKKYYEHSNKFSTSIFADYQESDEIEAYIHANIFKTLAWNKVVKRDLIEKYSMRFPIGRVGEDLVWCTDLLMCANGIVLCNFPLVAYRQRAGSLCATKNIDFQRKALSDVLALLDEAIKKYNVNEKKECVSRLAGDFLAYEYCWMLGAAFPFWKEYSNDIRKYQYLLDYDLVKKVALVKRVKKLIALRGTSFLLFMFMKIKNKR